MPSLQARAAFSKARECNPGSAEVAAKLHAAAPTTNRKGSVPAGAGLCIVSCMGLDARADTHARAQPWLHFTVKHGTLTTPTYA